MTDTWRSIVRDNEERYSPALKLSPGEKCLGLNIETGERLDFEVEQISEFLLTMNWQILRSESAKQCMHLTTCTKQDSWRSRRIGRRRSAKPTLLSIACDARMAAGYGLSDAAWPSAAVLMGAPCCLVGTITDINANEEALFEEKESFPPDCREH